MKKESKLSIGIALGVGFGTVVGVITDNIGLWLSVGVAIGVGVGTSMMQNGSKDNENK
jgi:2-keto-3-deoxy-6-phosphogluconate aldolase